MVKSKAICQSIALWILLGVSGLSAELRSQIDLGQSLITQGRYQEAARLLERVRDEAGQSGESKTMAMALNNLGAAYGHLQDLPRAERCFRGAAAIFESLGDVPSSLYPRAGLASLYVAHRRYSAAGAIFGDLLALGTRWLGPEHPFLGSVLAGMSWSAYMRGDFERASAFSERSLAIVRKEAPPDEPAIAWGVGSLGIIYRAQGKLEQASLLFAEAIGLLEKHDDPEHPAWIQALYNAGSLELARGHYDQAEALLKRALAMAEARPPAARQQVPAILRDYAQVLKKQGRKPEARKLAGRAATLQLQSSREDGSAFVVDVGSLSGRK